MDSNYAVAQLSQIDGPNPEERAHGDTKSLAIGVDPAKPAYWSMLSSGRMPPTLKLTAGRHASTQVVSVS
jgi:hypothetical protein